MNAQKDIGRIFGRKQHMGERSITITVAWLAVTAGFTGASANPTGGTVVAGQGEISAPAANTVQVTQTSKTLILNWDGFDIAKDEVTRFLQPNALALAVNRIGGNDPSQILGSLTANGRIILINPNGLLFGDTARINVGSLVATTHDLKDEDILGGRLNFDISGNPVATVENHGAITATSGSIAFVAPGVSNSGVMTARLGTVALAGASKFTLDFEGDNLISFPVGAEVIAHAVGSDGKPIDALVSNTGAIDGSMVVLSARSAADIVANAINIEGSVIARSARQDGDDIVLGEFEPEARERAARFALEHRPLVEKLSASPVQDKGGTIVIDGGTQGLVNVAGSLDASGADGGNIRATGAMIYADGLFIAEGIEGAGGTISLDGRWVSVGGMLSANGTTAGGSIDIDAGGLSFAGAMNAAGGSGAGGTVDIAVERKSLEFKGASIDVSGASGGSIRNVAAQQITTSATYSAIGTHGPGGTIDLSASATKLLSATLNASGFTAGGRIRVGGEYQGGRGLAADELPNASTTVASDGTALYADVLGSSGAGGEVIVWSDTETVFLGSIFARPGSEAGAGGFAEISSSELLQYAGYIETGVGGRQGTVLFDPKNINIVDVVASGIQLELVLAYNYVGNNLDVRDQFGWSLALDGDRLAVGARTDDGASGTVEDYGAVYLFKFDDASSFANLTLSGIVGVGYTGGNNVDLTGILEPGSSFGSAVSLDGTHLAVGVLGDNGVTNKCQGCGAVYLFNFADTAFSGGTLAARIGNGYSGPNDIHLAVRAADQFGSSVSLDGTRLAVGSARDNGDPANGCLSCGAVYLFTFDDSEFSGGTLGARIGHGFVRENDINLGGILDLHDQFGAAVSLDGTRLAVGAYGEDGYTDNCLACGAVYLFTFEDAVFSGGTLAARIGAGYSGGANLDLAGTLEQSDEFGVAVALDGTRLAVGAYLDKGATNSCGSCGAVYLFSFTDTSFSGGMLAGRIGDGYVGENDINLAGTLSSHEQFGGAVSLDGARLAIGAPQDNGDAGGCEWCGAVHLLSFSGEDFTAGELVGSIGAGYTGINDLNLNAPRATAGDHFGTSVALDGLKLAIGAPGDDGFGTTAQDDFGAIYLFSFNDETFAGAALEGVIGAGYTGGSNIDVSNFIEAFDRFGTSVALDGNRVAVGAAGDNGAENSCSDCGAVYFFTFDNADFSGGTPIGRAGYGYGGANDVHLPELEAGDGFGFSVSLDGGRIAIGSPGDDGVDNLCGACGAIYLLTFGDLNFSDGARAGQIGYGYHGTGNLDLSGTLEIADFFGGSVSLDGTRLAAGLYRDVTAGCYECGAVLLFTFSDLLFNNGTLAARIGVGYSGPKDINLTNALQAGDNFGFSVSLEGSRLAVGAAFDDGFLNNCLDCGAVHLFTFGDAAFNGGTPTGSIGHGYTSGVGFDLTASLRASDFFGQSLAMDAGRLAVGAVGDDGATNNCAQCGAVYLFTLDNGGGISDTLFSSSPDTDVTISKNALLQLLNSGQAVILQANNDITLSVDLVANRLLGNGGDLTLQAGRSVVLNGSIATDNGDLSILANAGDDTNVQFAHRDPGQAKIEMKPGTSIDAGFGAVWLRLDHGRDDSLIEGGSIILSNITAQTILIENLLENFGPAIDLGEIDVRLHGFLIATGSGSPLVIGVPGGKFLNFAGPEALDAPNGRWLGFSQRPILDRLDGLAADQVWGTFYNQFVPSEGIPGSDNKLVYSQQNTLESELLGLTREYNRNYGRYRSDQLELVLALILEQRGLYGSNLEGSRSAFVGLLNEEIEQARQSGGELDSGVVSGKVMQYAELAAAVYNFGSELPSGYRIIFKEQTLRSGLAYAVYADESGRVVLSFRGTSEGRDVATDILHLNNVLSPQQLEALAVTQKVIDQYGAENVTIVGHSLGGFLGQYTGSWTGLDAIAIDSAPFAKAAMVGSFQSNMLSTGLTEDIVHDCCGSDFRQLGTEYYFDFRLQGRTREQFTPSSLRRTLARYGASGFIFHSADLFVDVLEDYAPESPALAAEFRDTSTVRMPLSNRQ